MIRQRLELHDYVAGIRAHDRVVLAQAITLMESTRADDQSLALRLLDEVVPFTGGSVRLGISGVPGVGKSSFIEAFGALITNRGLRLAVLTVDPSSQRTHGSILGDKTRMEQLAKNPAAFIRPTPSGAMLGGVASRTRECMLLCEAAGFDVVIVETVGVGQSEVAVSRMVDFFMLLMLAGAGDDLQGIKKGIIELAHALVITKADGDNEKNATRAQSDYQHALHLVTPHEAVWTPRVLCTSAVTGKGIEETWNMINEFRNAMESSGEWSRHRSDQNRAWMRDYFDQLITQQVQHNEKLRGHLLALEQKVTDQTLSAYAAAQELLRTYHDTVRREKS